MLSIKAEASRIQNPGEAVSAEAEAAAAASVAEASPGFELYV